MMPARAARLTAVVALAGCAAACATVTRGSSTTWAVQTTPSGAKVVTSTGKSCEPTPCSISMARKSRFTAVITKAGYKPASIHVDHEISGAGAVGLAGNVLIGGLIGVGVDAVSGAALNLTPNPSIVSLERELGPPSLLAYAPAPPVLAPAVIATAPQVTVTYAPAPVVHEAVLVSEAPRPVVMRSAPPAAPEYAVVAAPRAAVTETIPTPAAPEPERIPAAAARSAVTRAWAPGRPARSASIITAVTVITAAGAVTFETYTDGAPD